MRDKIKRSHKENHFRERNLKHFTLKKVFSQCNIDSVASLLSICATWVGFI